MRTAKSYPALVERHPGIETIRLYSDVWGAFSIGLPVVNRLSLSNAKCRHCREGGWVWTPEGNP